MNVIGLDPSLASFGIAVAGKAWASRPGSLKGPARLAFHRREVMRAVRQFDVDLAVLEGYAFAKALAGVRAMGELGGVVRLALFDLGVPFLVVPPSSLKLFATGSGAADKALMIAAAMALGELIIAGPDEADAVWLHRVGLVVTGQREATEYQRRAVAGVEVPPGIRRLTGGWVR